MSVAVAVLRGIRARGPARGFKIFNLEVLQVVKHFGDLKEVRFNYFISQIKPSSREPFSFLKGSCVSAMRTGRKFIFVLARAHAGLIAVGFITGPQRCRIRGLANHWLLPFASRCR